MCLFWPFFPSFVSVIDKRRVCHFSPPGKKEGKSFLGPIDLSENAVSTSGRRVDAFDSFSSVHRIIPPPPTLCFPVSRAFPPERQRQGGQRAPGQSRRAISLYKAPTGRDARKRRGAGREHEKKGSLAFHVFVLPDLLPLLSLSVSFSLHLLHNTHTHTHIYTMFARQVFAQNIVKASGSMFRTLARQPVVGACGANGAAAVASTQFQVSQARLYHSKVIDHYQNPRNVGTMDKSLKDVGTGLVGAPACGDVMRLQIKVNDKTGVIEDVKFKTFGCGSAIASSSYATELVKGMTLDEAASIKNTTIAKELSLPPVKLHCSMLAEDAIKSAIKDYRAKRGRVTLGPDAGN